MRTISMLVCALALTLAACSESGFGDDSEVGEECEVASVDERAECIEDCLGDCEVEDDEFECDDDLSECQDECDGCGEGLRCSSAGLCVEGIG